MSPHQMAAKAARLEDAAYAAFTASLDARFDGNDIAEMRLANRGRALQDAADRATRLAIRLQNAPAVQA